LAVQQELFVKHCELAQELKLPLVIHSRDGFQETLDILQNYKDLVIYFHCRGYGPEEYKILENMFPKLFIGFCGNVTYKKAQALRDTLDIVSDDKLLLETDAPYLSPE
jgi:TatD DNase family protein